MEKGTICSAFAKPEWLAEHLCKVHHLDIDTAKQRSIQHEVSGNGIYTYWCPRCRKIIHVAEEKRADHLALHLNDEEKWRAGLTQGLKSPGMFLLRAKFERALAFAYASKTHGVGMNKRPK